MGIAAIQPWTTKLREVHKQLPFVPRALGLVWDAAPRWTVAWSMLLLVQGGLPVATVYATRALVNSLVVAKTAGGAWTSVEPALVLVGILGSIMILTEVLQRATDWVRAALSELVQDHVSALVHHQSAAVDLAFYESPDYYDRLNRARAEANTRPLALLENVGGLIQNGLTFLAMAIILLPYGTWLPLVLIASTGPAFFVVMRFNRRYHRWWERSTSDRRRAQYFDQMLTSGSCASEVRLFELGDYFGSAYQTLRRRLRDERIALGRDQGFAGMLASVVGLLVAGLACGWMAVRALQGTASLGDLALFYQAFSQGQNLLRSLLGNVGQVYSNSLFLGNLFEFLALKPAIVAPSEATPVPEGPTEGIRFRHVTFRYPGSQRAALRDFSLDIPAGRVVALMGTNGAGKTTLVKLLCRFYDPQSGRVELDGTDIRAFAPEELRRRISALFQFPLLYHATAAENIGVSDQRRASDRDAMVEAARTAGAHEMIARLPGGYDVLLGKWFSEGTDLSGGEWQRIALARAYFRSAPILILDEPTNSLDSWGEGEWLARFREGARGRTVLLITHRFTTARHADIIHVMQQGRLVESGSHDELVARDGLYAQAWKMQGTEASAPAFSGAVW